MRTVSIITAMLLTLSSQSAFAASGATTGTGSVDTETGLTENAKTVLEHVLSLAPGRIARTLKQLQVADKVQTAWENESSTVRTRMADLRAECREAIRRSNRDQRMGKVLQCQRSLLLQEANLLTKEAQYIGAIPLLDPKLKATATGTIANLENAQMAIIDGIDAGIFTSDEQLLSARTNLKTAYRSPYWVAKQRLRADRELTYIVFVANEIFERRDLETNPHLLMVADCLNSVATHLTLVKTSQDAAERAMELALARSESTLCREGLDELGRLDRQAAKEAAKMGTSGN